MNDKRHPKNWREVYTPPFKYWDEGMSILDSNELHVIDIRGWGHLTGRGGLNLPHEEAMKIQDAFGKKVAQLLNEAHGKPGSVYLINEPLKPVAA